ncbi:hypothetical protein FRC12_010487 [Ceratobasidium sp. 428]|nr:hypothetical protein FRC12_010487 [Ceratobasidium sp. 428]
MAVVARTIIAPCPIPCRSSAVSRQEGVAAEHRTQASAVKPNQTRAFKVRSPSVVQASQPPVSENHIEREQDPVMV